MTTPRVEFHEGNDGVECSFVLVGQIERVVVGGVEVVMEKDKTLV